MSGRGEGNGMWIRAPPSQVIAVAAIVGFWLWVASESSSVYMKILLPLLFMWMAYSLLRYGRLRLEVEAEPPMLTAPPGPGDSPWPVAFFLLLLLLLISYHPNWSF